VFDENLSEVSLITKDAFEPSLPLSVVVHIDYRKAPLVIQRFGDIKRLVEQTLDPMVSAYFKNIGQTRTLIQLIQDRSAIQQISGEQMKEKFAQYNLELQEVLIGTPTSGAVGSQIETILTQLRSRQIAQEQVETYTRQEKAAMKEKELREAESRAKQQTFITESELSINIQSNQGKAEYERSRQEAARIQTLAAAEAEKIRLLGEGEAKKIQAIAGADGRANGASRHRAGDGHRGAGAGVWWSPAAVDPAGPESLCRGDSSVRSRCGAEDPDRRTKWRKRQRTDDGERDGSAAHAHVVRQARH
jgi:uncharacterized membrane protein YqiK